MRLLVLLLLISYAAIGQSTKTTKWEVKADTLFSRSKYSKAITKYSNVISKIGEGETYWRCLYKRAVCLYQIKENKKSIADLDVFINRISTHRPAHILRALNYKELQKNNEQLRDIENALLLGFDTQLLKWKATLLLEMNHYAEAENDLKLILKISPDLETHCQLAYMYYENDFLDSALVQINKGIQLEPLQSLPYEYGAGFCLDKRKYDKCLEYVNMALALAPQNHNMTYYKGICLVEKGKKKEGCRYIKKAFEAGVDTAAGYLKEECYEAGK